MKAQYKQRITNLKRIRRRQLEQVARELTPHGKEVHTRIADWATRRIAELKAL